MPSVFTIEGTDESQNKALGEIDGGDKCKWVKNPRTGCEMQLCFVGKAESRTGWKFKKGSSRCPTRRR